MNNEEAKEAKEEKMLKYFKKETPEVILQELMNDKEKPPISSDLKNIAKLRKMGLNDEVINVLIHYSFLTGNGMRFLILELTAKHWLRQKISTAEEAIKQTRKEHQQHEKKKQENDLKEAQATSDIKSIKSAISAGVTNEQLGMFVRSLLHKQ